MVNSFFVVWGSGQPLFSDVLATIEEEMAVERVEHRKFETNKEDTALREIYQKSPAILEEKKEVCQTSYFSIIYVDDKFKNGFVMHRRELLRVCPKLHAMKMRLRKLFGDAPFVHTPDSIDAAAEQNKILISNSTLDDRNGKIGQFLAIFNEIQDSNYVVLRNFDHMYETSQFGDGDIDVLCDDREAICKSLNLKAVSGFKSRFVCWRGENYYQFDLREVDDGYFPVELAREILAKKVKRANFFIPNHEMHCLAFIYHIFFHKNIIQHKHVSYLNRLHFENINGQEPLSFLLDYMRKKEIAISIPDDISVSMNRPLLKKMGATTDLGLRRNIRAFKILLKRRIQSAIARVG